jgi:hypothetical protein
MMSARTLIQLFRVVDSSNNEYCLEAISPTTPIDKLDKRQFEPDGTPRTALGEMMAFLGVDSLPAPSHMIRPTDKGKPVSPGWVQVYRELVEWAILFAILKKDFGADTLIVCDGLLRSAAHWVLPYISSAAGEGMEPNPGPGQGCSGGLRPAPP